LRVRLFAVSIQKDRVDFAPLVVSHAPRDYSLEFIFTDSTLKNWVHFYIIQDIKLLLAPKLDSI